MKDKTILVHTARPAEGPVNRPLHRISTVVFPNLEAFDKLSHPEDQRRCYYYGRRGNPNSHDFEEALSALEQGYGAVTTPSGLSAITLALMSFVKPGDHILVADTAYGPTRAFCDHTLERIGVETEYYDATIGGGISSLIRDNTTIIFMESPGTQTYEVQDVPAIAKAAADRDVITMIDNTWATPLYFKPIIHGVDISIQAVTKYIGGHADVTMGAVTARTREQFERLKDVSGLLGICAAPDDLYMALRGLRTLAPRIKQHEDNARAVIEAVKDHPAVEKVLYPALEGDPGYEIWQRDFTGANGLFSIVLNDGDRESLRALIDGLELYSLGYSWGSYESIVMPCHLTGRKTESGRAYSGRTLLRVHIGLEDPQDLAVDLIAGLDRVSNG